ncbi:MAG: 2-amino-4-hydroxy-6-hydroxymethyldihydropteridine diphosphokinase, partial [Bdellovibrionales bacterium]|nr:2-amino-4-hydroxy-6-hydroxymethyldihydropteridine diphosphokinase [Bdellovibrionales bacterium]
ATIIETKPLTSSYLEEQSNFLNTVVKLESSRSPIEILGILQSIEVKLGRIRDPNFRWAPRTIDLDLLYVGNIVMSTKSLILPHPEIQNRIFVLEPLAEIAPNFIHPRLGLSTKEMILRLK